MKNLNKINLTRASYAQEIYRKDQERAKSHKEWMAILCKGKDDVLSLAKLGCPRAKKAAKILKYIN